MSFEQSLLEVLRNAAIVESLEWVAKEKMVTVIGVNDEPELDRES
ncbi:hypothetical protein F0726_02278 [Acidithiobacillus caldus]|nr:hypothetical protein F0726_02278 [Acidithiobacillus caldus]